jgi:serine/threonine protein kinase
MQGTRLDSYELVRRLGEGGMAQVYLARDVRLGREVAIKVLDRRLAERSGFRERFLKEAQLAAALDHPNIVPLYDYGESGVLYLVMPYLSGGSLQDALTRAPFLVSEVVTYATQMTEALDYAHQRGVVHRDVKPANMLLHADGRLMLADFGLAKILDGSPRPASRGGRPDAGTPEYMAPEQIKGRTDERSDLYGLGVVIYLLLTGRLPFSGSSSSAVMEGHLYRLPTPPRRLNPNVTPAIEAVVLKSLSKHPEDRYQRASEMGAALVEALVAGDAEPPPFSSVPSGASFPLPPMVSDISNVPQPPSPLSPHGGVFTSGGHGSGAAPGSGGRPGSMASYLPSLDAPVANAELPPRPPSSTASPHPPASGPTAGPAFSRGGARLVPAPDFAPRASSFPAAPAQRFDASVPLSPMPPRSAAPLVPEPSITPPSRPLPLRPVAPLASIETAGDTGALVQEGNGRVRLIIAVLITVLVIAAGLLGLVFWLQAHLF